MADKYWVGSGSTTNWNATVPTNWANTDGGAGDATVPAAGDRVFFTSNSGTGASVWNTAISLTMLDCTGSKNAITHGNVTITLSAGNVVLPTGVGGTYTTISTSAVFSFTGTAGTQQLTTNGFRPGGVTINGVGGTLQLQDNLQFFTDPLTNFTLTNGTFDAQAFSVTIGRFSAANANTKVLIGSGLWTLTGTGTVFSLVNTGTTVAAFTSNITATATVATTRSFTLTGGVTLQGTLTVGANTLGGLFALTTVMTLGTLSVIAPNTIRMPTGGVTVTLTTAPTITGSAGSEIGFISDNPGVAALLATSGTANFAWCAFRDMQWSGATFTAINSFDLGGNTGITITAPSGTGGGFSAGFF